MTEFAQVSDFISNIPVWGWILLVIAVLFVLGERILWDYEVKFPGRPEVGRAKVEFKRGKKRGTMVEVSLRLEPDYRGRPVEVLLKDRVVYTVPANKTGGERTFVNEPAQFDEPAEGDEVKVRIDGEVLFSGPLVLD